MKSIPVNSSNIKAVGFDPVAGILRVEFHSGGAVDHSGVPASVHSALMSADSHGRFYNEHIRGAAYLWAKAGGDIESRSSQEKRTEPAPSTIAEDHHHDADAALEAAARRFRGDH